MRWTVRYHRRATEGIYRIERGTVALVTNAIRNLAANPHPPNSEPVGELVNTYTIGAAGHIVAYELMESERVVFVLWVE